MRLIINNNSTRVVIGGRDVIEGKDVREELDNLLKVKKEGSFHIQRHMSKLGKKFKVDDYHRLLSKDNYFGTGFLPMVADFINEHNLKVIIEDVRENLPIMKRELDFTTPDFPLYEHQEDLIKSLYNTITIDGKDIYFPRGMWKAATNSGKTAASYSLVNNVVDAKTLFLVNNQTLFEQHIEYFTSVFGNIGKIGSVFVGYTRTGKPKYNYVYNPLPHFTIAMVGSLFAKMKKSEAVKAALWNTFNVLVVDESHDFSGDQSVAVIHHINAGMRLFMSGTPLLSPDAFKRAKLIGMSGRILHEVTKRYLMDNGFSMQAHVRIYENPEEQRTFLTFDEEEEAIILRSKKRAELVADLIAKRTKRKILIPFWEKLHGYLMYMTFIDKYPHLKNETAWVYGDDPERPRKIADYISGKITRLFTSTIMQQGINVKDIQTIINTIGGKDGTQVSQFMGRGERLDGINKDFEYIDIFDKGKHLSRHSLARIRFYKTEELKLKFMYEANKHGTPVDKKEL